MLKAIFSFGHRALTLLALVASLTSLASLSSVASASPNTLFEGYYQITIADMPVGYSITRYRFNPIQKQFEATVFTLTKGQGGAVIESTEAFAAEDLAPVKYSFTSVVGKKTQTIDATRAKDKMQIQERADGQVKNSSYDLPKGSFLSAFLVYVILKSPEGLKDEARYQYQAIAEETGKIESGVAVVEGREIFEGQEVFRIKNSFMGSEYFSLVTAKGEIVQTRAPKQAIRSQLLVSGRSGIGDFDFPEKTIRRLFGDIPKGQTHPLAKQPPAAAKESKEPSKGLGIPGGQGLQIKKGGQN